MKNKIVGVLTATGLAGMMLLGGVAPAQAAVGDLTNCKTSYRDVGPGVKYRTTWCDKQLDSLGIVKDRVITSSGYVFLKGSR